MREDLGLTNEQVEVLSGSMNVFMLASILTAGWSADLAGRRATLVLANAFLMAGALAMSLGATFPSLMAARFVTSVCVGLCLVVAPIYTAEIAPASIRGVLSSLLEIFVNAGILLSYVSNLAFAGLPPRVGWRAMFAAGVLRRRAGHAGVAAVARHARARRRDARRARAHLRRARRGRRQARGDQTRRLPGAADRRWEHEGKQPARRRSVVADHPTDLHQSARAAVLPSSIRH
jgi:MFS family permease